MVFEKRLISDMNWDSMCRSCLSDKRELKSIFIRDNVLKTDYTIHKMIESCTQLKVSLSDGLPNGICFHCEEMLRNAFSFRQQYRNSVNKLKEYLVNRNTFHHTKDKDASDVQSQFETVFVDTNSIGNEVTAKDTTYESLISEPDIKLEITEQSPTGYATDFVLEPCENITKKFECPECKQVFRSEVKLIEHEIAGIHKKTYKKKIKTCPVCNLQFTGLKQLSKHKLTHEYLFLCTACGKGFNRKCNLQKHMVTHSQVKAHMCNDCGMRFTLSENLLKHKRIHANDRRYKCQYCDKRFLHWSSLKCHVISAHTQEKTLCPMCPQTFSHKSSMIRHIRTHTGETPYPCTWCDKRFRDSKCLKDHLVTHTGERNYKCEVCEKAFGRKSNLRVHVKIHTGERSHFCPVCGRGFIQAHVLRGHLKVHRKQETALEKQEPDEHV